MDKLQLAEFVVTKGLTKEPEEYSDAKTQAHVQVRNRLCSWVSGFAAQRLPCRPILHLRPSLSPPSPLASAKPPRCAPRQPRGLEGGGAS